MMNVSNQFILNWFFAFPPPLHVQADDQISTCLFSPAEGLKQWKHNTDRN